MDAQSDSADVHASWLNQVEILLLRHPAPLVIPRAQMRKPS
jgi:hypothetical protein